MPQAEIRIRREPYYRLDAITQGMKRLGFQIVPCARPAEKCFPDGTNLHVTLRPMAWWNDLFAEHAGGKAFTLTETP